jgi:autotransporter translocation and assembly factor TamB
VSVESEAPERPSRLWRWLKRLLLLGAVLIAGLVIFHRPIILALLQWAGPQAALTKNLPLSWQVGGSLWNDLEIKDLQSGGGDTHWLPKLSLGSLAVHYNARADIEHIIKGIQLHDLEASVDLRKLPKTEVAIEKKQEPSGKAPPLIWPGYIDLKNLNADATLADGKRLLIKGLTLQVGDGMPGVFECRELRILPDGLALENLKAQVEWQPRLLVIKNFALPMDVVLDELRIDLKTFDAGEISTRVLAHLGAAKCAIDAQVTDTFGKNLRVKADVKTSDLRALELQTLGLPKDVDFDRGTLALHIEGDPLSPPAIKLQSEFSVANIRAVGARIDKVTLNLEVVDSKATLKTVSLTSGSNRVEVTAQASLPAKIEDWAKTTWKAQVQASVSDLKQLLEKPPAATGTITLKAKADGVGVTPTDVTGTLSGETLGFETYRLPKLSTQFALNGKEARFEIPGLQLGTGNQLSVKATMLMDEAMPVKAEWKLGLSEPMELFRVTGLKAPEKTVAAIIDLTGKADLQVKDLGAGSFDRLIADMILSVQKGRFGDSQLPSINLEAHAKEGRATLTPCAIRFDDENHLELTADVMMQKPFAFTTHGNIDMPTLVKLNALLRSLGAPEMKSGNLQSQLDAVGELKPWRCEGKATLRAAKVHPTTFPEAADLALDATFAGTKVDLQSLEAKLGLWKLALKGMVDERFASLTELKVWQKDTLLMQGHASAPFDIMQPGGPESQAMDVVIKATDLKLHEILAAAGVKDIPPGVLNADIAVKGRLETLDGLVKVSLRDVKVPNGPKAFTSATLDLDATLRGDQMKTLIKITQPPLQPLTVDASMPLDVDAVVKNPKLIQDTALKIVGRMAESDLSFLREYAPDMIQNLSAKMKLNADVTGTVAKPLIQATLDVDASEVSWAKADMPSVRDLRARLRVNDRKLNIEDISLMMAGGRVKLGGSVDTADMKNPALNLKIEAREALVFRDPTTSLRANADITCIGTLAAARVAGLVEAVRGRVFKEIDLMPVLKLPADVPAVPENTLRSEAKLALPPMLKDWTFDLRVKTRDPLLISGNLANGAISADVLLSGNGAAPQLTGVANIDRLLLKLPFSLVKITKGVVTLKPQTPFDPSLDIRGESRVGSNDITLYVYGDSTNPKTRFVSSPPMSEPDIVTLLATGTTLGGSASDLASEAASRAALLFVSELYRKTFNKKKVVREEPPRLHMTVNPSGADRSNDSVQAMYELTEKWRITGRFTQSGRMKALLGYVLRFGQAAQAVVEKK